MSILCTRYGMYWMRSARRFLYFVRRKNINGGACYIIKVVKKKKLAFRRIKPCAQQNSSNNNNNNRIIRVFERKKHKRKRI
jgi:hypothetical protein